MTAKPKTQSVSPSKTSRAGWLFAAALLVLLPLLWRGAGWWLRDAFADPRLSVRDALKGCGWDAALALGLGSLCALAGQLANRKVATAVRLLLLAVAASMMFLRCIDTSQCYLGHTHFTADSFMFWDTDWISGRRDPMVTGLASGFFVSAPLFGWAMWRMSRQRVGNWWQALLAMVLLLPAAWAVRDGVKYPAHPYSLRLVAETNFFLQLNEWLHPPKVDTKALVQLPVDREARFVKLGLLEPKPLADGYPLSKPGLGEPKLALARKAGVAADFRPNVVLTMVESQSRTFVAELSGHYKGLMPNLSALVQSETAVDGYYNTTAPTIAGLILTLCSLHAPSHPRDLQHGQRMDRNTPFVCLPDILRQTGYRTVFVQTTALESMGIEAFLRTHGVDEVFGRPQFRQKYPGRPEGPFGHHDDALIDYASEILQRLEAQRAKDGRPFLLVVLTIDTHEPGMAAESCQVPPNVTDLPAGEAQRKILAAFHCTDEQLGRWTKLLNAPERQDKTLWMLTGDHSILNTVNTRPLFLDDGDGLACSAGVWLTHDPLHELPKRPKVASGSQDLSPTLLHLLGLSERETTMGGHSIFGRRPGLPLVLGRVGGRTAYAQWQGADKLLRAELSGDELRRRCEANEPLFGAGSQDPQGFGACDFAAWLAWQDGLWDAKRLFPPARYHGDRFADKKRLDAEATLDW